MGPYKIKETELGYEVRVAHREEIRIMSPPGQKYTRADAEIVAKDLNELDELAFARFRKFIKDLCLQEKKSPNEVMFVLMTRLTSTTSQDTQRVFEGDVTGSEVSLASYNRSGTC